MTTLTRFFATFALCALLLFVSVPAAAEGALPLSLSVETLMLSPKITPPAESSTSRLDSVPHAFDSEVEFVISIDPEAPLPEPDTPPGREVVPGSIPSRDVM